MGVTRGMYIFVDFSEVQGLSIKVVGRARVLTLSGHVGNICVCMSAYQQLRRKALKCFNDKMKLEFTITTVQIFGEQLMSALQRSLCL